MNELNDKHIENLVMLKKYLMLNYDEIKPKFHMGFFCANLKEMDDYTFIETPAMMHECKTVGCLLGHAVSMFNKKELYKFAGYSDFSKHMYGCESLEPLYQYLFSAEWCSFMPSLEQALWRIDQVIDNNGVPEYFKADNRDDGFGPVWFIKSMKKTAEIYAAEKK